MVGDCGVIGPMSFLVTVIVIIDNASEAAATSRATAGRIGRRGSGGDAGVGVA
jgi:hypothetical protein